MTTQQTLITSPNLPHHDDVYEVLINAHAGLSDQQSSQLNAKLILVLANHIGCKDILSEAIALAAAKA
ncbi:MAG: hypothetical protein COA91_05615 [Robiginitomaculum sp.]|nr:MAG: hypothetical protein COA91_05615 [Robiginitomaculum sp.]